MWNTEKHDYFKNQSLFYKIKAGTGFLTLVTSRRGTEQGERNELELHTLRPTVISCGSGNAQAERENEYDSIEGGYVTKRPDK